LTGVLRRKPKLDAEASRIFWL